MSLFVERMFNGLADGTIYFAAGVFPYEGLYICALRAEDGSPLEQIRQSVGFRRVEVIDGVLRVNGRRILVRHAAATIALGAVARLDALAS